MGSDLAGRVVESFDFCSIASQVASCVSHRWNTLAVQWRELLHDVFWDEPGPQDWLAAFERLDEWNGDGPERIHSEEAATAAALIRDPVAARLRRLGPSRGAHVVDAGETIAASFVAYAEALPANGFKHRVLIVARDEDLGKWTAAFSGKEYYRGDFDASPNFAEYNYEEAEPLNVYVCSEQCMRRHWDAFSTINSDPNQQSRSRFVFVVDAGAGNANTMMPLVSLELNKLCSSGYVVSKPLPPQGLDFEEAIFRLHWANALMADLIVEPLLRRGEGPLHRASSIRLLNPYSDASRRTGGQATSAKSSGATSLSASSRSTTPSPCRWWKAPNQA